MKLADLAYEVARDSIEFPSGFNKYGFVRGDFDDDRDFSTQISFAFNYINLAFARLFSSKKNLLKIVKKTPSATGYFDFADGEVTAIVSDLSRDYERVHFKPFGDGFAVEEDFASKVVYVEYRPFIPHFDLSSIREQALEDNRVVFEEVDVELEDYGINDEMCAYVKEYAKGGLMEYLSPDLSQKHTQMAENYFSMLKTRHTDYPQRKIEDRLGVGGLL